MSRNFRPACRNFSFLLLFLLFFQVSRAQEGFTPLDEIVAARQQAVKSDVVLVVASKDTVVYQKDSKQFSALRGQAAIGASSQWLTAALVLLAVDEGKLSLDDKVGQYIPIFDSYMKSYITLRHCLSHFTGIQSEAPKALRVFEKKKFASLEEEVLGYAKKPIQNNAGEAFRYNQMGPGIAARVLEIVYKKKFEMLAQQKLFRPLGMRMTTFATMDASAPDPAEGARSTAADMTRFLTLLLNKGQYKDKRILSEEAVLELRRIQTRPDLIKYKPEGTNGYAYALGAWTSGEGAGKEASVLLAPSFGGTVPVIDFCRGYAFIILQKDLKEDKTEVSGKIREVLDSRFENTSCP
ncbi:serine hydrolase [Paraflavisolibacter sp. H34]|uniref:serine hydrolase domain-containing protein n=1 Tax=Huijunlia imazamoxiresistens TaxID=3127457 RepID=UPI0030184603